MSEPDSHLIQEFCDRRSEEAFAALVERHVNLVFATALRLTGSRGIAEEITQSVFVAVAQSAGKLGQHPTLAGWLYQTTLNKARERVRSELRRERREQVAIANQLARADGESIWASVIPLLDEALLQLREADRVAVLMHFMEGHSFGDVGATLGIGEDAARKRVQRSLNELTSFFRRRGLAVPTLTASVPLFALSTQAAPAGLVASATLAAMNVTPAISTGIGAMLVKGLIMTKTQTAIVGLVVATGVVTPLILQHQSASRLREENAALRTELSERASGIGPAIEPAPTQSMVPDDQQRELMRLRGEVSRLRTDLADLQVQTQRVHAGMPQNPMKPAFSEDWGLSPEDLRGSIPRHSLAFSGYRTAKDALFSVLWAESVGDVRTLVNSYTPALLQSLATNYWEGKTESDIAGMLGEKWAGVSEIKLFSVSPQGSKVFIMISLNGDKRSQAGYTLEKQDNEWRVAR